MSAFLIYSLQAIILQTLFVIVFEIFFKKETFFKANRIYLIGSLILSFIIPLIEIPIDLIDQEQAIIQLKEIVITRNNSVFNIEEKASTYSFIFIIYLIGFLIFFGLFFYKLIKIFNLIKRSKHFKNNQSNLFYIENSNQAFSFFNFIFIGTDNQNFDVIVKHELVHAKQWHSLDILIVEILKIVFWFNPILYHYHKRFIELHEFEADMKSANEDKKKYFEVLLCQILNCNSISLTNNFYNQSLIKKRIIMLNKNQSHKRNLVKYTLILPLLIGFIFLFQIKVIAQEKKQSTTTNKTHSDNEVNVTLNKNTTDAEMKNDIAVLKKEYDITLKYSKVRRNNAGEITRIKAEFKDKDGNKGVSQVDGKEPIKPIHFYKNNKGIGFVSPKEVRVSTNHERIKNDFHTPVAVDDSITITDDFNLNFDIDFEVPEAPESPEAEGFTSNDNSNVIIKRINGKKPTIIINGKLIKNDKEIEEALRKYGGKGKGFSFSSSSDGDEKQLFINGKNMMKIKSDATADAEDQMKKMRPLVNKQKEMMLAQREKFKAEMERVKIEMKKSRADMDSKKPDMESYKADMEATKAEMQKAKIEMERAKLEFEKAKAELNTPKK